MSDWGWVAFGYVVVYGGLLLYTAFLTRRHRKARLRLEHQD